MLRSRLEAKEMYLPLCCRLRPAGSRASGEVDRPCPRSRAPARQHLCWTLRDPDRCLGVPRSRSRCVRTFTCARWVCNAAPKEHERAPETAQSQYALPFTPSNDLRKEIEVHFSTSSLVFKRELLRYWRRVREENLPSPSSG